MVSLLSAPPGLGKGWWTWGWLRAMQDGGDFFGLRVPRPVHGAAGGWPGGSGPRPTPLKVLWLTEEGASFGRDGQAVRHRARAGDGAAAPRGGGRRTGRRSSGSVRREAWRRGCAYVIVDTIRAWCPQAEQSNDQRRGGVQPRPAGAGRRPGLGVLFVHHDRKGGGEYGEGVAGPNNLVGLVRRADRAAPGQGRPHRPADARLPALRRPGRDGPPGRRPLRRSGGAECRTGRGGGRAPRRRCPPHLAGHAGRAPPGRRRRASCGRTSRWRPRAAAPPSPACRRPCGSWAWSPETGAGVKGAPAAAGGRSTPSRRPAPPTADPAYVRYLNSQAWAAKRAEILDRADGRCEECGAELRAGEAEVHHLTYERVVPGAAGGPGRAVPRVPPAGARLTGGYHGCNPAALGIARRAPATRPAGASAGVRRAAPEVAGLPLLLLGAGGLPRRRASRQERGLGRRRRPPRGLVLGDRRLRLLPVGRLRPEGAEHPLAVASRHRPPPAAGFWRACAAREPSGHGPSRGAGHTPPRSPAAKGGPPSRRRRRIAPSPAGAHGPGTGRARRTVAGAPPGERPPEEP